MKEKKEIIKDAFRLTTARYTSQGIGFFTSIAMRRFLGPFYIGIWSLLNVIADYVPYLFLGVNEGAAYKIPVLLGQKKEREVEEVTDAAFNFIFFISFLTSLGVLIAAIILRRSYPVEVVVGLFALSIYILMDRMCGYYMLLLRARSNFLVLSRSIIFDAVINLILIMSIVRKYNIYGLYFVVIGITILNTIYIHMLAKYRINLNFKFKGIAELMKRGLPISILGVLEWILASVDRIMIAKMIGVVYVGYYSISIMTKNYVSQLSGFGTVLYPRMLSAFSKNENIEDVKKFIIIPPKVNAYMLPLLLGLIFFIAPVLIKQVLPKFIPGIIAIQILLIDIFFRACYPQAIHFAIALKKQVRIIPIMIGAIILTILGDYLFIKKGYGIYGVAWATSIVSFLTFLALQGYAIKHIADRNTIFLFFVEIIAPFLYTALVVLLIENLIKIPNIYAETLLKCIILFLFSIPLLHHINRQTQVINILIKMIRETVFRKTA